MDENPEVDKLIEERFAQLPQIVKDAFTSADVTKHLQQLASSHKLHLDQWQKLETQVQYTLLGIEPIEQLEANIKKSVDVPDDVAHTLAEDISHTVFEPIREELERQLSNPDAKEKKVGSIDAARDSILAGEHAQTDQPSATESMTSPVKPSPATPPPEKPDTESQRSPISETYISGTPSHQRKSIDGDPYREQLG